MRKREEVEEELKLSIHKHIVELNQITGMFVSDIDIRLIESDDTNGNRTIYIGLIDIEYKSY